MRYGTLSLKLKERKDNGKLKNFRAVYERVRWRPSGGGDGRCARFKGLAGGGDGYDFGPAKRHWEDGTARACRVCL